MRKLFLTSVTYKLSESAEETFTGQHLVVVNTTDQEDENEQRCKADQQALIYYKTTWPGKFLLSSVTSPTIGPDRTQVTEEVNMIKSIASRTGQTEESPFSQGGWYTSEEIPTNGTEAETEQVLVDVDGNRKMFAIGYYDKNEKDWYVYHSREFLDLQHMKWTYLPINADLSGSGKI